MFMQVNSTNKDVVSKKEVRPYAELADLSVQPKLIAPMVRTGVNPVTGVPTQCDFLGGIVECLPNTEEKSDNPNPIVIGERREFLKSLFNRRAGFLFNNMENEFSHRLEIELKSLGLSDMCREIDFPYYRDKSDHIQIMPEGIFTRSYYAYNDVFAPMDEGGNVRRTVSKLLDLEYYMHMPTATICEEMLSRVTFAYTTVMNSLDSALLREPNRYKEQYDEFKKYFCKKMAEFVSCAEAIVLLLVSEATAIFHNAGYPGLHGISYDDTMKIANNSNGTEVSVEVCHK